MALVCCSGDNFLMSLTKRVFVRVSLSSLYPLLPIRSVRVHVKIEIDTFKIGNLNN